MKESRYNRLQNRINEMHGLPVFIHTVDEHGNTEKIPGYVPRKDNNDILNNKKLIIYRNLINDCAYANKRELNLNEYNAVEISQDLIENPFGFGLSKVDLAYIIGEVKKAKIRTFSKNSEVPKPLSRQGIYPDPEDLTSNEEETYKKLLDRSEGELTSKEKENIQQWSARNDGLPYNPQEDYSDKNSPSKQQRDFKKLIPKGLTTNEYYED